MMTLTSNDHLVDLDDCLSMGGMSDDDDLMAMIGDEDAAASVSVFEDIMIPVGQEHESALDRREEISRADSIRSLDDACWIDDELFVDAVDFFEDEEPAQAQMHFSQGFGMQKQQQMMNAQRHQMQQQSNGTNTNGNAAFEEVWNAKMAQLARSMKRSEATRHQVIRQREVLLAEQKQRQQQQLVQQQQRQHAAEQSRYLSSTSSSMMGGFQVSGAFAKQGRRLSGFMSSMGRNVM
jgi:hypothetical protein